LAPAASCRSNRNAKVRVMMVARALMRHQEKAKVYGKISAKAPAVLTALLLRFHNAATGKCFSVIRGDRLRPPAAPGARCTSDPRPGAGRRPVLRESHQERSRVRAPTVRQLVQRRCAEPGRRHSFQSVGPWRGSPARRKVRPRADQTARIAAPATRCNDVAWISQFRGFAGSISFETTPRGGLWVSADRRSSSKPTSGPWCSTRARWEIRRKINGLGQKPLFLEGRST
jgi:hypothetical protein